MMKNLFFVLGFWIDYENIDSTAPIVLFVLDTKLFLKIETGYME